MTLSVAAVHAVCLTTARRRCGSPDGHVLLELSHRPAELRERPVRWVAVAKQPSWVPETVSAPVGAVQGFKGMCCADLKSSVPKSWH